MKIMGCVLIAVMAIGFTNASASTDREAQMMRERNVSADVLADRVEACLRTDPAGTACKPKGSNATAADYVTAIRAHQSGRFTDVTVESLPGFLRALTPYTIPDNLTMCLSGMRGNQVSTSCVAERLPHNGEVGWYQGNVLVLAGDCMNSVVLTSKSLRQVEVEDKAWRRATSREWKDPFPKQANECTLDGARLTGVHVFGAEALQTACAREYVIDRSRYTSGRGTVGSWVRTGDEDVFSLQCGAEMHALVKKGEISWARQPHRVELNLVHDGQVETIFTGTVAGNVLSASDENSALLLTPDNLFVDVPAELTAGMLVWHFPDGMASPTESGAGMDISRLQRSEGCRARVKVASAIEGGSGHQVAYE